MKVFILIGQFFGYLSLIIPRKASYPWYLVKRAFVTARSKGAVKKFGKGSLIAPGVKLYTPKYISVGNNSSIMSNCIIETCPINENKPDFLPFVVA